MMINVSVPHNMDQPHKHNVHQDKSTPPKHMTSFI